MSGFRFSKAIERGLGSLAALSLFLMMVVTFIDVMSRNMLNAPILGATEMIEVLLAIMVFMAFPLVSWQEENICVDLLDNYFPNKWIGLRQIIINLICACSLILVAITNWKLAERSLEYEESHRDPRTTPWLCHLPDFNHWLYRWRINSIQRHSIR